MMRRFPIQVWKSITYWLDTVEIGKLLCCGDVVVTEKLRKGGLEEINLNWPHSSWIRYPTFTFPSVRSLSIKSSLAGHLCRTMKFGTLPTNLRSLLLHFDDLFVLMKRQNVCLSTLVPSLARLDLEGFCGTDSLRDYFVDGLLERLPPQLEHLRLCPQHLDAWQNPPSTASLHRFPTTLASVRLEFVIIDDGSAQHIVFPPHLEELYILDLSVADDTDLLSKLPSSLLHLDLTCYRLTDRWTVRPLYVNVSDAKWPPRLQTLRGGYKLGLEDLPFLPPTVTDAHLRDMGKEYKDAVTLLPSNLKNAEGVFVGHLTMEIVRKLPSSLERTDELYLDSPASCDLTQHLPNLKHLTIVGDWRNKPMEGFVLPSRLTELNLPLVNDDICLLLPKTLRSFEVGGGAIGDIGAAALTRELEELDFPASSFAQDSVLRHLGHVVTIRLRVNENAEINLTSRFLEQVEVVGQNGWKELEILYSSDNVPWPNCSEFGRTFICLPHLQRFARAPNGTGLPPASFSDFHFPPSLRSLFISGLSSEPTPNELRRLPRTLQDLSLSWKGGVPLGPDAISALPPALHKLFLSHVRANIHYLLPSYLYVCAIPHSGFLSPLQRIYPETLRKRSSSYSYAPINATYI